MGSYNPALSTLYPSYGLSCFPYYNLGPSDHHQLHYQTQNDGQDTEGWFSTDVQIVKPSLEASGQAGPLTACIVKFLKGSCCK